MQVAETSAAKSRMTLDSVKKGREKSPDRIFAYGVEGVGKSTMAASAKNPIFLCAEDGVGHLDVAKFPVPRSWEEVLEAIENLRTAKHEYQTLVIDTLDWIERDILHPRILRESKWDAKEAEDYGRWYKLTIPYWRRLIASLELLRHERGMEIILLAHSRQKTVNNPMGPDFDRYIPAFGGNSGYDVWKQYVDSVLFLAFEDAVVKVGNKVKGSSTGNRLMYTQREASFDAKTRHAIPPVLPLSYDAYASARDGATSEDPKKLMEVARSLVIQAGLVGEEMDAAAKYFREHATDGKALAIGINRLKVRVEESRRDVPAANETTK